MARFPKYKPTEETRRQVLAMTGMGLNQSQVSLLLKVDSKTLRKFYRWELDAGVHEANLRVAQSLYEMATRLKIPSAAMFWMRARAGWKDRDATSLEEPAEAIRFEWAPAMASLPQPANAAPTLEAERTEIVWDTNDP